MTSKTAKYVEENGMQNPGKSKMLVTAAAKLIQFNFPDDSLFDAPS